MMTKTEIRKDLAELHTLEKATEIVICNDEAVKELAIERLSRMALLMRIILKERKLILEDHFTEKLDEIEEIESLLVNDEYSLENGRLGNINYLIHSAETYIQIGVLDKK